MKKFALVLSLLFSVTAFAQDVEVKGAVAAQLLAQITQAGSAVAYADAVQCSRKVTKGATRYDCTAVVQNAVGEIINPASVADGEALYRAVIASGIFGNNEPEYFSIAEITCEADGSSCRLEF